MGIYRVNVARCNCCQRYEARNLRQDELLVEMKKKGWKGNAQKLYCDKCEAVYYGTFIRIAHYLNDDGVQTLAEVANKKVTVYIPVEQIFSYEGDNVEAALKKYLYKNNIAHLYYRGATATAFGDKKIYIAYYDKDMTMKEGLYKK